MAKPAWRSPSPFTVALAGPFLVSLVAMFLVLALPISSASTLWRVGSREVGPNQLPAWLAAATGLVLGVRYMRSIHAATESPELGPELRVASFVGAALIGAVWGAFAGFWGIAVAYVVYIVGALLASLV